MSEKQPQYIMLEGSTREDIQTKINSFAEDGYRVHSYTYATYHYPDEGILEDKYTALLYLDVGNYDGVTNIADVPTGDTQRYLDNGWEIASASISTKFVRMIKRATPETS